LAGLKNQSGVFREKIQLIRYMDPKGTIIANSDDDHLKAIRKKDYKQKIIRFGCGPHADHRAGNMIIQNNYQLQFKVRSRTFTVKSPVIHNVYNALAAISCGLLYKIRYNDISNAISRFQFREARQEIIKNGRFWLIDDTYNANPLSLKSAVTTLNNLHIKGKRIIVCADMLELGPRSKALHQLAGRMIADSAVNAVFTFGRYARYITESLNRSNGIEAVHCNDLNEVHRQLKSYCTPGDAVLVKGSRDMNMERTVVFFKTHFK